VQYINQIQCLARTLYESSLTLAIVSTQKEVQTQKALSPKYTSTV
jgi:hypothetical protein